MKNILVDSSVIISFYDQTDVNHDRATTDLETNKSQDIKLWVVSHVVDEVASILLKRNFPKQLLDFLQLIQSGWFSLFLPKNMLCERELVMKTLSQVANQARSKISFTDMYQLVLSKSDQLTNSEIMSYDHHLQ